MSSSYYFEVEVGPGAETFESYMKKVFARIGLTTNSSIKAYEKFTGHSFFRDMVSNAKSNPAVSEALRNSKGKIIKISVQVFPAVVDNLRLFGINLSVNPKGKATFTGYSSKFSSNVRKYQNFTPAPETPISQWTTVQKLDSVIRRAALLLPEDVGNQLLGLLEPWALAVMAVVLGIWVVGHFFVASEIADAALLILGGVFLGLAAFQAGEHLVSFAIKCFDGRTEKDLDESARHLSEAIAIIGVQAVMALLLAKAPKVFRESRVLMKNPVVEPYNFKTIGDPPTSSKIFFENYEGKLSFDKHPYAGETAGGLTTQWGDIIISYGKNTKFSEIEMTFFHERVHRFLTPRLQVFKSLRQTAAILKRNSYLQSYILRYLEEALAETVAQVKGNGWRSFFNGIKFPVSEGYVTLAKMGTEAKGIFLGPINVGGIVFNVYFTYQKDEIKDQRK